MSLISAMAPVDYYFGQGTKGLKQSTGHEKNLYLNITYAGSLARELGLKKKMSMSEIENVFSGHTPDGIALLPNSGPDHKGGLDLAFSATKPTSVARARAGDKLRSDIEDADSYAVFEAFKFLEKYTSLVRTGKNGKKIENAQGFAAILVHHHTSRSDEMQMHTHVLLLNLTKRGNGKWATLYERPLFDYQVAAICIYRAMLAMRLRCLGFEIVRVPDTDFFSYVGNRDDVCKTFSTRTDEIKSKTEQMGLEHAGASAKNRVAIYSRKEKTHIQLEVLLVRWQTKMSELGYHEIDLHNSLNSHNQPVFEPLPITKIISNLTEKHAVITEPQIFECIAREAQFFHITLQDIIDTFDDILQDKRVLGPKRDRSNIKIYSTFRMLNIEKKLVAIADVLRTQVEHELPKEIVEQAIQQQESAQGFPLSNEQKISVIAVCKTGIDILQGRAGAGKSTSMTALRIAYQSAGYKVVGATIAKKASQQLENDTGIESGTLARLLIDVRYRPSTFAKTVILIDEAGLVSSSDLFWLLKGIETTGAKLVLVGETEQLRAIEKAGCLLRLSKRFGFGELITIYRQGTKWARTIVNDLRVGKAERALQVMNDKGLLNIVKNKIESMKLLVAHWESFVHKNPTKDWMIMANSWNDVKPLNELVRNRLQDMGKIGGENIEAECVVSQKYFLQVFSRGDRVRFTQIEADKDLVNGETGTVLKVKKVNEDILFSIRKDSGKTVQFLKSEYEDNNGGLQLVHAYAFTVYSSQGSTIDGDTFVMYSTGMDRAASYVAGSRQKDNCHWFVDGSALDNYGESTVTEGQSLEQRRLDTLAKCMETDRCRGMALDYWGSIN